MLFCVMTAVFWLGGIWRMHNLSGSRHGYYWTLRLGGGEISIERTGDPGGLDTGFEWSSDELGGIVRKGRYPSFVSQSDSTLLGVSIRRRHERIHWLSPPVDLYTNSVALSYWLIILLTLILPASRLCFRKRQLPGHCPRCHYDLRATPERCPECGHVPVGAGDKSD